MITTYPVCFFFGANTAKGFVGFHQTDLYDPRDGWSAFLIKSGAGTGKATFMRDIHDTVCAEGLHAETILCSSDPSSLDAVIFPEIKLCVVDATAPHILEPIAYGECEQLVPFGCCLKDCLLENTDAWFRDSDACSQAHARCCRFLRAASVLRDTSIRLLQSAVNEDKLIASVDRLSRREFGQAAPIGGRLTRRFLSAVTPEGFVFLSDTATALCPRLYVLDDPDNAVSASYMQRLCDNALQAGYDAIACHHILSPDSISHLLIPSLGVGFLTCDRLHPVDFPVYRRIHAVRFLDETARKTHKARLRFHHRAVYSLLDEAVDAAKEAKAHHDVMEQRHIAGMDWACWEQVAAASKERLRAVVRQRLS